MYYEARAIVVPVVTVATQEDATETRPSRRFWPKIILVVYYNLKFPRGHLNHHPHPQIVNLIPSVASPIVLIPNLLQTTTIARDCAILVIEPSYLSDGHTLLTKTSKQNHLPQVLRCKLISSMWLSDRCYY